MGTVPPRAKRSGNAALLVSASPNCPPLPFAKFFFTLLLARRNATKTTRDKPMMNLVGEIAAKAAGLPLEQQREALAFIETLLVQKAPAPLSFQSIEGIIPRQIEGLEEDLAEMRVAMNDPLFLADMQEMTEDFRYVDAK